MAKGANEPSSPPGLPRRDDDWPARTTAANRAVCANRVPLSVGPGAEFGDDRCIMNQRFVGDLNHMRGARDQLEQLEKGQLLEQAAAGRQPDSDVTVAPTARPVRVNPPGRTCPPGKPTSGISAGPSNPRSGPRRSVRSAARWRNTPEPWVLSAHHIVRALRMGLAKA